MREHPRAIAYRKNGILVPDADKRALGVRRDALLSIGALEEITPAGLPMFSCERAMALAEAAHPLPRLTSNKNVGNSDAAPSRVQMKLSRAQWRGYEL